MWQCNYADETIDKKLFWLCTLKKLWILAAGICAASLLVGGGYFLCRNLPASEKQYCAQGDVYVDYIPEDGYGISTVYLNEDVWKALVKSDAFVEKVSARLAQEGVAISREQILESVDASLEKETRIVTVKATAADPAAAEIMADALLQAVLDYGDSYKDIASAYVLTAVNGAKRVVTDDWTGRLFLLGAVLGAFVSLTGILLSVTLDDSVYVPEQFERRYGIKMFGVAGNERTNENITYTLREAKRVVLATPEEDVAAGEIEKGLQALLGENVRVETVPGQTGNTDALRQADGIVLAVESGRHDGKRIESLLRFLDQQGCTVAGAVLLHPDERLLGQYYGFRKGKRR